MAALSICEAMACAVGFTDSAQLKVVVWLFYIMVDGFIAGHVTANFSHAIWVEAEFKV